MNLISRTFSGTVLSDDDRHHYYYRSDLSMRCHMSVYLGCATKQRAFIWNGLQLADSSLAKKTVSTELTQHHCKTC